MTSDTSNRLSEHDHKVVQEAIGILLQKRTKTGWPLTDKTIACFMILDSLSNRAGLGFSSMQILDEMVRRGETSSDGFLRLARDMSKARSSAGPSHTTRWRLLVPLRCKLSGDIGGRPSVVVLGTRYYFSDWRRVRRFADRSRLQAELTRLTSKFQPKLPSTCVVFESDGASLPDAWRKVDPSFDVFRSIFEITYNWGRTSMSWPERARRRLPHPEWFIGVSEKGDVGSGHFSFEEDPVAKRDEFEIEKEDFDALRQNACIQKIIPKPNSILSLIVDCHRLYVQAMDSRFNYGALLSFWQLAEAITLSEEIGGNTREVCRRLLWASEPYGKGWGLSHDSILVLLTSIAEKRNHIVHRGVRSGIDDNDVNMLKLVCESGMHRLLGISKKLKTIEELKTFYSYWNMPEKRMTVLRSALAAI